MNKREALKLLLDGNKVRNKGWRSDEYIFLSSKLYKITDEAGFSYSKMKEWLRDLDEGDWEIYKKANK